MKYLIYVFAALTIAGCGTSTKEDQQPATIRQNNGNTLMTGWYRVVDSSAFRRNNEYDTGWYYIDPSPIVTAENIKDMQVFEYDMGGFGLGMRLTDNVVAIWEQATSQASINREQVAFILNDRLVAAATVQAPIPNGSTALSVPGATRKKLEAIRQEIEKEIPK